jgi:hypothetical protein
VGTLLPTVVGVRPVSLRRKPAATKYASEEIREHHGEDDRQGPAEVVVFCLGGSAPLRVLFVVASGMAPLVSSVWIDRHRRTASRRDGPVLDPVPSDAVGSVDEFSAWRLPVRHDHHDPGVEVSLGMIDVW